MSQSKHGWPATLHVGHAGLDRHGTVSVPMSHGARGARGNEEPLDRWQADYSEGGDLAPPEVGDGYALFRYGYADPEAWTAIVGWKNPPGLGTTDTWRGDIPTKKEAIAWARATLRSFRD